MNNQFNNQMGNQMGHLDTKITVHVPPKMWSNFRDSMIKSRIFNEEVIGFIFCQRHQVSDFRFRYIPKTWVVPDSDCYEHQSTSGLVLKQHFHSYLLENHLRPGLDVVHIHTHAGTGTPSFSHVDDRYESEYAQFITSSFPGKPRLVSGVFDENLQLGYFRMWDNSGQSYQGVNFCNSLLEIPDNSDILGSSNYSHLNSSNSNLNYSNLNSSDLMFMRQKIFGEENQKALNNIKVGLIGCGGIGSIFAESLSRLGVKNWVLVDPDKLETVNLNRMPGSTPEMVNQQWYKVIYVKHLIQKIYHDNCCVETIPTVIEKESAQRAISSCDLIVVATDNHLSRKTAQELALEYMRPLICLGTHIDVKTAIASHNPLGVIASPYNTAKTDISRTNPNIINTNITNTPRMYCRVTVPPLGGGWCLMCGNTISLQHAALESAPPDINNMAANAGYVEGVNDPAVFWLNGICASTGVGIIHGIVSGFLNVDSGIDWIYEFPKNEWHKTNTEYLHNDDCLFCSIDGTEYSLPESDFEDSDFEFEGINEDAEFEGTAFESTKAHQSFGDNSDSEDSDFIIW